MGVDNLINLEVGLPAKIVFQTGASELSKRYEELTEIDPTDEHWKFSKLADVLPHAMDLADRASAIKPHPLFSALSSRLHAPVLEVLNGAAIKPLESAGGFRFAEVPGGEEAAEHLGLFSHQVLLDKFSCFSMISARSAQLIQVPQNHHAGPLMVLQNYVAGKAIAPSWLMVRLEEGASLVLIEVVRAGGQVFGTGLTQVFLGPGARLDYYRLDVSEASTTVVSQVDVRGLEGSALRACLAMVGDGDNRTVFASALLGRGAESELYCVTRARGEQHCDMRTLQEHIGSATRSHMESATVLEDRAEAVYDGLVRMKKGAIKSVANQINRNLLLSPDATANSVPNLDIEENDVRCDHASSVGPLDEEQLHYLRSRGVGELKARELLVAGFYRRVLANFPNVEVAETVRTALREEG